MSEKRQIATSFWDDPWVSRQSERIQRLYLYLLTNRYANIAGVYEETSEQINAHLHLGRYLEPSLVYLAQEHKVYRWGDYIIMRNWPKHQNTKSRDVCAGIERVLKDLPLDLLDYISSVGYAYAGLGLVIQYARQVLAQTAPGPEMPPETMGGLSGDGLGTMGGLSGDGLGTMGGLSPDGLVLYSTLPNLTLPNVDNPEDGAVRPSAMRPSGAGDPRKRQIDEALAGIREAMTAGTAGGESPTGDW